MTARKRPRHGPTREETLIQHAAFEIWKLTGFAAGRHPDSEELARRIITRALRRGRSIERHQGKHAKPRLRIDGRPARRVSKKRLLEILERTAVVDPAILRGDETVLTALGSSQTAQMLQRFHCDRCAMSFVVSAPPTKVCDIGRCGDCGMRFWHSTLTTNRSVVVCGVFNRPEPIPAIGPPAEFSGYGGRTPNPGAEA